MKLIQVFEEIAISEAAATPNILCSESELFLIFYLHDESLRNPQTTEIFNVGIDKLIRIQFPNFLSYRFGVPNWDGLQNHPLSELGMEACKIYKLQDSPWLEDLVEDYKNSDARSNELWNASEHYIFTFKDTCFEIIAHKVIIKTDTELTMKEELSAVADQM